MLSASQQLTLKNDMAANNNTVIINGVATAIKNVPHGGENAQTIANWYNLAAVPDFFVFDSKVPVASIYDQVTWTNFTPADAVPADTALNVAVWSARSSSCQGRQFNLQTMLVGRDTLDAGKLTQRAGLNDATANNLPSGTSGALRSGGWANILNILRRKATNVEKMFAVQTSGVGVTGADALGATTNPALLVFDGSDVPLYGSDVISAWG